MAYNQQNDSYWNCKKMLNSDFENYSNYRITACDCNKSFQKLKEDNNEDKSNILKNEQNLISLFVIKANQIDFYTYDLISKSIYSGPESITTNINLDFTIKKIHRVDCNNKGISGV